MPKSPDPESRPERDALRDATDMAAGATVNFLGTLARISKAGFVFFAARWYGTETLGLYFLAYGLADIVSKLALWGLDRSLIHSITRHDDPPARAGALRFHVQVGAGLSLVVAALLAGTAPLVAGRLFSNPALTTPIRLAGLGLPFLVIGQILLAALRARRIMRYDAAIKGGLEPAVLLVLTLGLWPLKIGATALMLAQVSAFATTAAAAWMAVKRVCGPAPLRGPRPGTQERRNILRFAAPLSLMDAMNMLIARVDLLLVGALMSSGAAGVYGILMEIVSSIKRVRQSFEPIFAPIVAELYQRSDLRRLQRGYALLTRWLLAGSALPLIVLMLFGHEILSIFQVREPRAFTALLILAVAQAVYGVCSASENLLVMSGHTGLNTGVTVSVVALSGVAGFLLIPPLGIAGGALATLAALTTAGLARVGLSRRHTGVRAAAGYLVWPLFSASVTLLVGFGLKGLITGPLKITVLVASIVLYCALLLARANQPEERHIVERIRNALPFHAAR
ncbi:MAG: lipopolysaccharide biosynthesis protein [Acidobacteriota bacterium]